MVTICRHAGFRIVIYTNDHDPAHVHAIKAGGEAKINLMGAAGGPALVWADGLNRGEVRRAIQIVEDNCTAFIEEWRKIHG